ncbi:XdhC family aldehyde oxidoreductase maturation factor [Clostridium sp. OS1-26]|uniref:XdhC family aldehyde oxidoreductase maturation factor n=1 Tax=Clostridium sp. OS1-26 TaxID=3070681 RepID=UPI0027DEDEFE|nr:xanthine dehydrogenase accessory protein XdhC [Clostridium sp. OS1-26]WML33760.1 xanthine dehydrogenase accessory protein XdhC [Clostridium sp. OS1-26]
MFQIYDIASELIDKRESFVLATILDKNGSAPRRRGSKMIIKKDYSIIGTIGGGLFEALTIKLSKEVFHNRKAIIKNLDLSTECGGSLEIVCGGELKVLMEYIDAENNNIAEIYKQSANLRKQGKNFSIVTRIESKDEIFHNSCKWICTEADFYGEESDVVQPVFQKIRENFKEVAMQVFMANNEKYLVEPVLNYETIYLFGAGHVSQKLAEVMKILDFKVVVLDDRREFANKERFKTADKIIILSNFDDILKYVDINDQSYVVIITRGHAYDKDILAQALETDAKYIGMIGSKTKRSFIYSQLKDEGYTQKELDRVFCPIGLEISAQTPEEIAISIAAELIKIRRCSK